jgi:hypothetical protein
MRGIIKRKAEVHRQIVALLGLLHSSLPISAVVVVMLGAMFSKLTNLTSLLARSRCTQAPGLSFRLVL